MKLDWKQFASKSCLGFALFSGAFLSQLPIPAKAQAPATTVDPKLLALARAGDTKSQLLLGYAYNKGEGAPVDLDEASAWYHKAADGGDPTAQFALGWAYLYGGFGTEDHRQASTWFRKAAEHAGSIDLSKVPTMFLGQNAFGTLGFLYDDGKDLPQDYSQAAFWYRKAADYKQAKEWLEKAVNQGDAMAAYNLGTMYAKGQGVPQQAGSAYALFDIAAARLTGPEQIDAEKNRDLTASLLTPEVISRAQEAAEKWFAKFPVQR